MTAKVYALSKSRIYLLVHQLPRGRPPHAVDPAAVERQLAEDAVAIVVQCNGNAEKAAAELCARSFREWRAEEEVVDDITAVVVYF